MREDNRSQSINEESKEDLQRRLLHMTQHVEALVKMVRPVLQSQETHRAILSYSIGILSFLCFINKIIILGTVMFLISTLIVIRKLTILSGKSFLSKIIINTLLDEKAMKKQKQNGQFSKRR